VALSPDVPRRAAEPSATEGERLVAGKPELREIQWRLQQLGATHYVLELLEAWKEQPQAYHFCCTVAVTRGGDQTQTFEATADEPRPAMANVLRQVERWRGLSGT
jgi:hypothetical protein